MSTEMHCAVTIVFDGEDSRGLPIRILKRGNDVRMLDYHAFIASEKLEQTEGLDEMEAQWKAAQPPVDVVSTRLSDHLSNAVKTQLRLLCA